MTAELVGDDGRRLALAPLGYEHVDREHSLTGTDQHEAWLSIRLEATDGKRSWSATAPFATDVELRGVVRWLRGLGTGNLGTAEIEFLEPCLKLRAQWQSGQIQLEARMFLELDPESPGYLDEDGGARVWIETTLNDIERFAEQLNASLRPFPEA